MKLYSGTSLNRVRHKLTSLRFIIIFISSILYASATPVKKVIRIGTTASHTPYLYKENFTGVEIDLIKEAFISKGYTQFEHVDISFKRSIKLLTDDDVDAITTNIINNHYSQYKNVYKSNPILDYIDCAITLRQNNIQINKMKDLKGKRVWAFSSAKESLGKEYNDAIKLTAEYNQHTTQLLQPKALVLGRMDVAISDINIFMSQATKDNIPRDKFKAFQILKPTKRVLRFTNKELRNEFNRGLKKIISSGKYAEILLKYKGIYFSKCEI